MSRSRRVCAPSACPNLRALRTRLIPVVVAGTAGCLVLPGAAVAAGPPTFAAPVVAGATGDGPASVAIGDVDGDRRPDLVTADQSAQTVSVLTQAADGTYATSTAGSISGLGVPRSVAIADLNADGRPDLATATGNFSPGVFTQNADRTFTVTRPGGAGGTALAIGDLNADGRPDIVLADPDNQVVSLLIQQANGTYSPANVFFPGVRPGAVAIGDLNGDRRPDLAITDAASGLVGVLRQNAGGGFERAEAGSTLAPSRSIAIADVNGDGRPDLVSAHSDQNAVFVLTQNADGTFTGSTVQTGNASSPRSVVVGDLNADGRPDLAAACTGNDSVAVLTQRADGGFDAGTAGFLPGDSEPGTIAIGDTDADGRPDLVTAEREDDTVSVLRNTTAPATPTPTPAPAPTPTTTAPAAPAAPSSPTTPSALTPITVTPVVARQPAKLSVSRARLSTAKRRLEFTASLSKLASGTAVVVFRSAGRTSTYRVPVRNGRLVVSRRITAAQARLGTGIVGVIYGGDGDTRPQSLRLRVAPRAAGLTASRPTISAGGRLVASGRVARGVRGVVRLLLRYATADGSVRERGYRARISNRRWRVSEQLSTGVRRQIAARRGAVQATIVYTGSLASRTRGESIELQVLGDR